jgi:predicted RNA-binding protein with PIN domain
MYENYEIFIKTFSLSWFLRHAMSRLLIDGYNLLYKAYPSGPPGEVETQEIIESLRKYKRMKSHSITIILDSYERGMPTERKEQQKGIGVVYTRLGEKADQKIERQVDRWGGSCIVVTSDQELARSVEKKGAAVISSEEFIERLKMAEYMEFKGEREETETRTGRIHTEKKGNPNKKSKKERARSRRLRKL